jgi:crotonobetainyl-CoA:carnitine CoA-transferase CaiB-like acyl-CoA transferase
LTGRRVGPAAAAPPLDAQRALGELLDVLGVTGPVRERVLITGSEPAMLSRHRIGTASAVALAAYGAATAQFWALRSGVEQDVSVNIARATQALYVSAHTRRSDGIDSQTGPFGRNRVTGGMPGCHRCADGRWVMLVVGSARPHQLRRTLEVLGCTGEQIPQAVARWDGAALEEAIYERGAVAGLVRTAREWRATPQGGYLLGRPVVEIEKIGDGPPRPGGAGPVSRAVPQRPMSGLRVLDMTHVIAGPMISRTLAEHGGDVLHITGPVNYDPESFLVDLGVGKRNAVVDLAAPAGRQALTELARGADVFVQSYRPGALDGRGFAPADLADRNPGIVVVSVSCYGGDGPTGRRRGVDPVAQAVTGLAHAEARADGVPQMNRMWTLTDPLVGYLGAAGTMAALARRAAEGGSYHVRVSLAACAMWLQDLGPSGGEPVDGLPLTLDSLVEPRTVQLESPDFSRLTYLAPAVDFSHTAAHWDRPPERAGSSAASWL